MLAGRDRGPDEGDEEGHGREGASRARDDEGRDAAAQDPRSMPAAAEGLSAGQLHGDPPVAAAEGPPRALRLDSPRLALRAFPSPVTLPLPLLIPLSLAPSLSLSLTLSKERRVN